MAATTETLCSLARMGLEANALLLAKLLSSDPMDPAIEIMADVRAYFQGLPLARRSSSLCLTHT